MTQHNTPTTQSSNTRSSLLSPLLDERRGHAAGLDDVADLTLYANADTYTDGISSAHAEDDDCHDPVLAGSVTSVPTTILQAGGPSPEFRNESSASFVEHHNHDHNIPLDPTAAVPEGQKHLVTPSGATGAFLGLCLGGPVGAALWGFGAAYAVRKDGTIGDLARSLGEVGLTARDKFLELDEKHHLQQWTQDVMEDSKVVAVAADGIHSVVEYTKRHQLLERGIENTGRGFEYLADKIAGSASEESRDDVGFDYQALNEEFRRNNDGTFYY
mmetsp:Transcript_133782/g.198944  ORF Transcript_133782/g.198944 Transcript_133782/m.198944 type:complete len:272 (+) Transcript_133782:83-898(+)